MKSLKMPKTDVTRREFMRVSAFATAGTILAACGAGDAPAAEAPMEEAAGRGGIGPVDAVFDVWRSAAAGRDGGQRRIAAGRRASARQPAGGGRPGRYRQTTAGSGEPVSRGRPITSRSTRLLIRGVLSINQELTINPMIAESWSVSDDATEYTFNLRQGMKWSSGKTV